MSIEEKTMSRRGVVGRVTPIQTSKAVDELGTLLPDGIRIDEIRLNISHGTMEEFHSALPLYEKNIGVLARKGVDVIQAAGTPPFMLLGYRGEQELIADWEKKFRVPLFTSGSNQVRALRALGIRKMVGIGYDFEDTTIVERYFSGAGFDVLKLKKLPGPWEDVEKIKADRIVDEIKMLYLEHKDADGVYIQGAKINILDVVGALEEDLQVPVLHPAVANAWEIMLRLDARVPKDGYGRLLSEMPAAC